MEKNKNLYFVFKSAWKVKNIVLLFTHYLAHCAVEHKNNQGSML